MAYRHEIFKSRHDPSIDAIAIQGGSYRACLFQPTSTRAMVERQSFNSPFNNNSNSSYKSSQKRHNNWEHTKDRNPKTIAKSPELKPTEQKMDEPADNRDNVDQCLRDAYMENILEELLRLGYEKTYIYAVLPIIRAIRANQNTDKNITSSTSNANNEGCIIDENIEYLYQHMKLRILSNQFSRSDYFDTQTEKVLHLCAAFVDTVEMIKRLLQ